ncbi:MAG: 2Fe-2S iron-sulfur cluster binding domain-containing protein [Alphaproteobacteria bacterium]|nr:2Fe-2S iron-sulfur cluster binding domain-containing protein [Alphaproteobacteria bacterium]
MKLIVVDHEGNEHALEALEGWRAMEVIRDWGFDIKAECGGACSCATCHVFVDDTWIEMLDTASEEEENMLDMVPDVEANSRLSCQILMSDALDGLRLKLAPSARGDE